MTNKERIIAISKELKLSHIGSNLSCLPTLEEIYKKKKPEDIVILDNAHAHLAHLVVKYGESVENFDQIYFIKEFGIHCDRKAGCDASGGSLGHGIGLGIGYALADRKRDVYVIVSDGSMMEGSNWEALRIANDLHLKNIHIHCNFNGYTAVAERSSGELITDMSLMAVGIDIHYRLSKNGKDFEGVGGHYKVL